MPRKSTTSNPNRRSRKFAARGKAVNSSDLQGLQATRKAEVSRYNSVKNTDSAYSGQRSRGRGFLRNLVAKRKMDEADGPIDDGICTALLAKAFDDGPPNKYSALALEMFIVQKCFNEGCGKDTADGIHGAFAALWDDLYVSHASSANIFIDLIIYFTEMEINTQANTLATKRLVKLRDAQHVQAMSRQLYTQ